MKCELGAICSRLSSGKSIPAKLVHSEGKYPVYGGNGLRGYTDSYNFEGECAIIGRQGAFCGNVRYFKGAAYMTEHAVVVCANERHNTRYLAYLLSTMQLGRLSAQSAQPGLSVKTLSKQIINLPSLEIQNKVVAILCALDDKIELNNKINENLEQQVYALFESWFMSFDKNEEIVPNDWYRGTLGEIASITSGKRPPMKQSFSTAEIKIPLVGASSVMGYTNAVLYNEPILVTGRVGTHGIVQRFRTPCWASDNTLVIKSDFYEYTYQVLLRVDYTNMNRGSTQPLITQTDLKNAPIVVPPKSVILKFEQIAGTLMAKHQANHEENKRLSGLRDTLLPKLMSGEIDVEDVNI